VEDYATPFDDTGEPDPLPDYQGKFMSHTSRGWERAWGEIAKKYGGTRCDFEGEAWQYMGSYSYDNGATFAHDFRHRALPPNGDLAYDKIPALAEDFEDIAAESRRQGD